MANPVPEVTKQREVRAWELRQKGWTQERIAAELGVDQATVSRALKRTRKQVQKALEDRAEQEALIQLAQLDHVQAEAMEQWERSKQDAEEHKVADTKDGPMETVTRTGQTGDPRLLQRAMEAMQARRKILGIDAPEKHELTGKDGGGIEIRWVDADLS